MRPLNVPFVQFPHPEVDEKLAPVTWGHEIFEIDVSLKRNRPYL
jgi:hypothetical protein